MKSNSALVRTVRIYIRIFLDIKGPICSIPEKPTFLPTLPVFIETMLRDIYGPICKHANFFGGGKEYECIKCKGTFKNFFQHFWLLYAFLVRMTACTLGIELFCWHQEPKWPQ